MKSEVDRIFEIDDLEELRGYLSGFPDADSLRSALTERFLGLVRYRNVNEWNMAVRLCEALAITGWGSREPLEAVRGCWPNGNPETFFADRYGRVWFLDAVWSGRKDGYAIDSARSSIVDASGECGPLSSDYVPEAQQGALRSQRNWIPKNPVLITRGLDNCYPSSRPLIESMERELRPALDERMRPGLYGTALNRIILNCSFSFFDNPHCKTNYIIADESLRLRQRDFYPALLRMFSEREIEENGYYLRNRFTYGPFRRDTGLTRVGIVLEREFSFQPESVQREVLAGYFVEAATQVARRLERKIDYDFRLLLDDFRAVLKWWCRK